MLKQKLDSWLLAAFTEVASRFNKPAAAIKIIIVDSKSDDHGDFCCSSALSLAKQWHMAPENIANAVLELPWPKFIAKAWVAKPGFINIQITQSYLADFLLHMQDDLSYGLPASPEKTIIIDYSSPNLAKALHVGHLRSSIIGDSLVRINTYLNHKVIKQNHVGDWGTQFGMILAYLAQNKTNLTNDIEHLEQIYQEAKKSFDTDAEFAASARNCVVKLQAGEPKLTALWQQFLQISISHCTKLYQRLGLLLTDSDIVGESFYQNRLHELVKKLLAEQILVKSDGAVCYFSRATMLLQKQDGGFLYSTTDLAAADYRLHELAADQVLYVVDKRQALHFDLLFDLVGACGWAKDKLKHVGFGTVNDANGKPFKTRAGGTIKLEQLLDEATKKAQAIAVAKQADSTVAEQIAIAAIKYFDLSKPRTSDYAFSYEQMLRFDGNTAPYLLYAYVRLNKLAVANFAVTWQFTTAIERNLAQQLIKFTEVVQQASADAMPHYLCNYLYDLSVLSMQFYENCPVNLADAVIKKERQNMCYLVKNVLQKGLYLLGISTLAQM